MPVFILQKRHAISGHGRGRDGWSPSSRVPELKRDHWIQRYHRNDSCGPRLDTEFAGRHGAKIV